MDKQHKGPKTIGVILDGNRRWARAKGLPAFEGHRQGANNLGEFLRVIKDRGVTTAYFYAFSTENWNRESLEIEFLFALFREMAKKTKADFIKEKTRVRFVGQIERFPTDVISAIRDLEEATKEFVEYTAVFCISYGGRAEITEGIKKIINARISESEVNEEKVREFLWTKDLPDPDMIIRTGGAQRLSNFLLWQGSYAELFFTETHWPAFTEKEFDSMLLEYEHRERRFGK